MYVYLGDIPAGVTFPFFFPAYDAAGGSVTITGLATTDLECYKGTSMTQRASDNGFALIETDGIDLDSRTGIHGFSVDFSDNSDAGFYAAGSFYNLVVDAITVDSQTVRFIYAFRLVAAESVAGTPKADASHFGGTAGTFTVAGKPDVTLANGPHGGTSATARWGSTTSTPAWYVTNSGGTAAKYESTGGNGHGTENVGNGTGAGLKNTGGNTGIADNGDGAGMLLVGGNDAPALGLISGTAGYCLLGLTDENSYAAVRFRNEGASAQQLDILPSGGDLVFQTANVDNYFDTLSMGHLTIAGTISASTNALPWPAAWTTAVQAVIEVNNLDHLLKIAVDTDFDTTVHVNSVIGHLASTSDGGYARSSDSQEAIRDRGDAAWVTATGFALASVCTEGRLAELDAGNLPTDVAAVKSDTAAILADTGTDGVVVAAASKTGYALTTAYDLYHVDIHFTRDQANTKDEWTATFFKNGVRQTSGITTPVIQVVKRADGTDLVASTAMTQIGLTGSYKLDESTNRLTAGEAALAVVTATIDSASRSFSRVISRDST